MKKQFLAGLALCIAGMATNAQSAIVTYGGFNTGGPTYNRVLEDFSALSIVGTGVSYDLLDFTVSATGTYTFLETAGYDSFLYLYQDDFNPVAPLSNGVVANDDLLGLRTSGFAADLTAGTSYHAVLAGFGNTDNGEHSLTIGGEGDISLSGTGSSSFFTYEGTNAGGPTYNRALEDFSGLSIVGTDVSYDLLSFSVDTAGTYTFLETAGYDSFLYLYQDSFDPLNPLANALEANDDFLSVTTSGLGVDLLPGISYYAVLASYANDIVGDHSLTIGGPGHILTASGAVPEPASWAMMIAGFGAVGFALRRQRAWRGRTALA